ncbi:hypothetical protein RchiOBHm_Chr7g0204781 [Rosa chinensis]|uniref:Uncharacterized protein n=1 Tax=Rosa chinensis TaxID=74649 RepID=A0A2P6P8S2_ROSCH|nr:hypothetical protein RchiOBHm_Chr7g0204781 [Rosa chinensis]
MHCNPLYKEAPIINENTQQIPLKFSFSTTRYQHEALTLKQLAANIPPVHHLPDLRFPPNFGRRSLSSQRFWNRKKK